MSIPRAFIDEIIARTDIVELIDTYVSLRKVGENYQACCPFHQEKTPSFIVNPNKKFYYCFGCQVHGNIISFLIEYGHLEFIEAIHELADRLGLEIPEEETNSSIYQQIQQIKPLYQLLSDVSDYYQQQLQQTAADEVRAYLKNRGISMETAAYFKLGYAPTAWNSLLRQFPQQQDDLMLAGLLSQKDEGKIYDRFRSRLIFPINDLRNRVIAFGGRVLDDSKPKYINSPESPLFHKSDTLYGLNLAKSHKLPYLLVVEGYMDVVALQQHGFLWAVATLGTAATDSHFKQLFRTVDKIIFCFDGDQAGKKAAWRVLNTILPYLKGQRQVLFLFLSEGEDPDSVVQNQGLETFNTLLKTAQPLSQILFERIAKQADIQKVDWQGRIFALAKPLLDKLPQGPSRDFFINKLAEIDPKNISQCVPQIGQKAVNNLNTLQKQRYSSYKKQNKVAIRISPMRMVIALLLQQPFLIDEIEDLDMIDKLTMRGALLLQSLLDFIQKNPHTSSGAIIENWRDTETLKHLSTLLTWQQYLDDEQRRTEFKASLQRLIKLQSDNRLDQLLQQSRLTTLSDTEKQELRQLLIR